MWMVGFASSARFVEHDSGPYHPERADRIRAVLKAVRDAGMIDSPNPFPDFDLDMQIKPAAGMKLKELEFEPAAEEWLYSVHSPRHVQFVKHVCRIGGGVLDQGDTVVCRRSHEIAMLALGAVLRCCDAVMSGQVKRAFAAVRPPGHHAEPERAMGFCLYSNVAVAARYLQVRHHVERVAIVDFDVHHGNGTQAAFERDPNVFFISMHQSPHTCYPRSGYEWEIGTGPGRGYTLNLPFEAGCDDKDYLKVVDARVLPELEEFNPQVLLISAGFDAHQEDPLASMNLSEEGFELITRSLVALADRHCAARVVSVLEGGYNLRALGRSVVRHLIGLQ